MLNSRSDIHISANDGKGNVFVRGRAKIDDLSSPVIDSLRQDVQEIKNTLRGTSNSQGPPSIVQQVNNARLNTLEENLRNLENKLNDFISRTDERLTNIENSFVDVNTETSTANESTSDSIVSSSDSTTSTETPKVIVLKRVAGTASNKIVRYAW